MRLGEIFGRKVEVLDWADVSRLIFKLWGKLKACRPELVVGILRGGVFPALLLADLYGVPIETIRVEHYHWWRRLPRVKIGEPPPPTVEGKIVLLVDDVADTGESLRAAYECLKAKGARQVETAVLHVKPWRKFHPSFFVRETDAWVVYPWELGEFLRGVMSEALLKGLKREEALEALTGLGLSRRVLEAILKPKV